MKRIVAGTICFILAVLMVLSVVVGLFGQAAVVNEVQISLKSSTLQAKQGDTVKVDVMMDTSDFTESDLGVQAFTGLKVTFDRNRFEYSTFESSYTVSKTNSNELTISFNSSKSSSVQPIMDNTKLLCSLYFKVLASAAVGSTGDISLNKTNAVFYDNNNFNSNITCTISNPIIIEVTDALSNNAFLKSLSTQEGNLKPTFNKNTTSYTVAVDNDVTRLNVIANVEDTLSKINIIGNTNLKIGENTIQVIVTAQDGSSKIYKITAKRADGNNSSIESESSEESSTSSGLTADAYTKKLQAEQNKNLLINLFLIFIILCLLAYIIVLKYGDKLFKGKQKK
jgi:hypothetical protein